jgi:hypothetical protein
MLYNKINTLEEVHIDMIIKENTTIVIDVILTTQKLGQISILIIDYDSKSSQAAYKQGELQMKCFKRPH